MSDVPYPAPAFRDWALFAISLAFVAAGLVVLPSAPDQAIVTVAFFGTCAAFFAATIIRKLRYRRMHGLRVEISGGVPIRQSRGFRIALGAGLAALGAVLVVFGRGYGIVFWSISWFMAAAGAALILGVLSGRIAAGYIQFDPHGITFAQRNWAYTVPWDNISEIAGGELNSNAVLSIWLHDLKAVDVTPPDAAHDVFKAFFKSIRWTGAPITIMTAHYGVALPLLVSAMERYISEPAAREELVPRLPAPAPAA